MKNPRFHLGYEMGGAIQARGSNGVRCASNGATSQEQKKNICGLRRPGRWAEAFRVMAWNGVHIGGSQNDPQTTAG